jgi:DNA-binding PucR family transcriptional regulator
VAPEHAAEVREAILHYGRELAFATADIYAHAAEVRGAWDARLEALVVDSVMRGDADESVRSRASALGWVETGDVTVVVGRAPGQQSDSARESVVDEVRTAARHAGLATLGAVQGDRLVIVAGGVSDPDKVGAILAGRFGPGPVVVGPAVPDLLQAHVSAAEAVAGLRAAAGWPAGPALLTSDDLLAERSLDGDALARSRLVTEVYLPLSAAQSGVLDTLTAFLDHGSSIEGTARHLYVHPNTVRYRLKRVSDITALSPTDARNAFTLRIALVLGRLHDSRTGRSDSL